MSSFNELSIPLVTEENICLPLVINAVSKYWNVDLPMSEAIESAEKYQEVNGSIIIEGIELAERYGLASLVLNSSIIKLKKMIDIGIPPIVIMPGLYQTIQHASIISGYDDIEKIIMHYIPKSDQVGAIPEQKFDKLWYEDNRVMLLIAPTDIIYTIRPKNNMLEKSNRLCFISERLTIKNRISEAMQLLKKSLEINDKNPTLLCMLGSLLNKKNSSDCIKYYKKCISINDKYYLAYRGLGNYYLKNKQFEIAENYYTKAIKINPSRFGPIYKNRGITRLEKNKKNLAKQDFSDYLKYTPDAHDKDTVLEALKNIYV